LFGQLNEHFDGTTFPPVNRSLVTGTGDWDWSNQVADHTTGNDKFTRYDCYTINGTLPAGLITPVMDVTAGDKTFAFWANYYFIEGSWGSGTELMISARISSGTMPFLRSLKNS